MYRIETNQDNPGYPGYPVRSARRWLKRHQVGVGLLVLTLLLAGAGWLLFRPHDSGLRQIQASGVWRVGMDPSFPPFENVDPATGQPAGFDVDLTNAIAAHWGVRAEIVPMGFDQLIDAVAARRIDAAISAMPVAEHRTREVWFSEPYIDAGIVLAAPPGSPITGTLALAGRRLAVEWGSQSDAEARALQKEVGGIDLALQESAAAALEATANGSADAALVDAVSLALFQRAGGHIAIIGPPVRSDPYVVVVPARSTGMVAAINRALADLRADGTLERLKGRWLSEEMP